MKRVVDPHAFFLKELPLQDSFLSPIMEIHIPVRSEYDLSHMVSTEVLLQYIYGIERELSGKQRNKKSVS